MAVVTGMALSSCNPSGDGGQTTPAPSVQSGAIVLEGVFDGDRVLLGNALGAFGAYPAGGIVLAPGDTLTLRPLISNVPMPSFYTSNPTVLGIAPTTKGAVAVFQALATGKASVLARTPNCVNPIPKNPGETVVCTILAVTVKPK